MGIVPSDTTLTVNFRSTNPRSSNAAVGAITSVTEPVLEFPNRVDLDGVKVNNVINPNDIQRSIRAYEVKMFTNKSLIDWYKNTKSHFLPHNFIKIYFDCPRDLLLKRIKTRINKILPEAVKEVKKIQKLKIPKGNSSNKIIGINEIKYFIDKKLNKDQTVELIAIKTRQYAKRQATWARGQMKNWKTLSSNDTKLSLKKLFN